MIIKILGRLLFILVAMGVAGLLIKLGLDYGDAFYYVFAALVFLIALISVVNKEKLPRVGFPLIKLKISPISLFRSLRHINPLELEGNGSDKKLLTRSNLYLSLGFIIFLFFLSYLIIFELPKGTENNNFIFVLINAFKIYIQTHQLLIISLALTLLVFNLIIFIRFKKMEGRVKRVSFSLFTSIAEISVAPLLALLLVFCLTLILSNSIIFVSNYSPDFFNIHTDKNEIKQTIEQSEMDFKLVGVTDTPPKTFVVNFPLVARKGDYFVMNFIPSIPNFLFLNSQITNSHIYLIKNTLVIREMDKDVIQTFAPTLVKKIIKKDLSPRHIKDEPNVEVISRQDYLRYREEQINKQIDEITGYIEEAKKLLGTYAYNIQVARNNISIIQNNITLNTQYRDEEYNNCISATWTYYGYYSSYTYRRYTDAYCQNLRNQRDQQNAQYQSEIQTNQNNLSYYQSLYNELKFYLDQFQDYKSFIEATKEITPYELGLFEPERSVRVVLDSVGSEDISNFLATLTHEYLHYSSYVSEESSLPQFFEEGITEYLARRVVSNQLDYKTNQGYPTIVKIISAMVEKIPVSQLEEIYFNKNSEQLINLLDQTYGKDFYTDTELYFALIPYSPPEEALKFANNIMAKIGGPNLEENDLYSD